MTLATQTDTTAASDRIEILWRPPLDVKVWGYGSRIDTGGWIYRLYRAGSKIMSGSAHHCDLAAVKTRVAGYAAQKAMHDVPVFVLSLPPA